MPVDWHDRRTAPERSGACSFSAGDPPLLRLELWPNRSLPPRGFAAVILGTFALVLVPLLSVLGSPVLWGLLPFVLAVVWGLWWALRRSYRDGEIVEELSLWPDHAALIRRQRGRAPKSWQANPFWVTLRKYENGGPVENYLTLRGGGREVELGAFLSQDERAELYTRLKTALAEIAALSGGGPRTAAP